MCGHPVARTDDGWSSRRHGQFKRCPRCAESVDAAAVVCKHCRFNFEAAARGGCGPALLSLIIPGLGQLVRGEFVAAVVYFLVAVALWSAFLGWIVNLVSAVAAYGGGAPPARSDFSA